MVGDAKFETQKNREAVSNWIEENRTASKDFDLSEEEVIVVTETQDTEKISVVKRKNLVIALPENGLNNLARILQLLQQTSGTNIEHIESRPNEFDRKRFDIFMSVMISPTNLLKFMKSMRMAGLGEISLLREKLISVKGKKTNQFN